MKMIKILSLVFLLAILASCSGSDTYRGLWKATDSGGNKFEITFNAKDFDIKDSAGKSEKYEYTQNSVKISNSVKTYGIKIADGRLYRIHFPKSNDDNVGVILDGNGNALYAISRKNYITQEDIYKLQ